MENKLAILFGVLTFFCLYSTKPNCLVYSGNAFSIGMYSPSCETYADTIVEDYIECYTLDADEVTSKSMEHVYRPTLTR